MNNEYKTPIQTLIHPKERKKETKKEEMDIEDR